MRGGYFIVDGVPHASIPVRALDGTTVVKRKLTRLASGGSLTFAMIPVEDEGPTSCMGNASCPVSKTISLINGAGVETAITISGPTTPFDPANQVPEVKFDPQKSEEGRPVRYNLQVNDPDGGPAPSTEFWRASSCVRYTTYTPRLGEPTTAPPSANCWTRVGSTNPSNLTFPDDGQVTVLGRYTDGNSGWVERTVLSMITNVEPVLALKSTNTTIFEGDTITVKGDVTDPGVLDVITLQFRWGDGTVETAKINCTTLIVFGGETPRTGGQCDPASTFSYSGVGGRTRSFSISHRDTQLTIGNTILFSLKDDASTSVLNSGGGSNYRVLAIPVIPGGAPAVGSLVVPALTKARMPSSWRRQRTAAAACALPAPL